MSHRHHCDKCGADYAYDTTHACNYGSRIEELEARLEELESAPRLVVAYQAYVAVAGAFSDHTAKPRLIGTYLDKGRAAEVAATAAETIRREPGCYAPGQVQPQPPYPMLVASAVGCWNIVVLGGTVDLTT